MTIPSASSADSAPSDLDGSDADSADSADSVADPFGTSALRSAVLAAWAASPARFREDANAEESLTIGYADRVVAELAANAADAAHAGGVPGRLWIRIVDRELRAANTGAPLTADGVAALASLRASAKRAPTPRRAPGGQAESGPISADQSDHTGYPGPRAIRRAFWRRLHRGSRAHRRAVGGVDHRRDQVLGRRHIGGGCGARRAGSGRRDSGAVRAGRGASAAVAGTRVRRAASRRLRQRGQAAAARRRRRCRALRCAHRPGVPRPVVGASRSPVGAAGRPRSRPSGRRRNGRLRGSRATADRRGLGSRSPRRLPNRWPSRSTALSGDSASSPRPAEYPTTCWPTARWRSAVVVRGG